MTVPVNVGAAQAVVEPVLRALRERDQAREIISRFDSAVATVEQRQDYADAVRLIHPRHAAPLSREQERGAIQALLVLLVWMVGVTWLVAWLLPGGAGPFSGVTLGLLGAALSVVVIGGLVLIHGALFPDGA